MSTLGDLASWVDALRSGRLLQPSSVDLLFPNPPDVLAYGGANAFGFNSVIVEAPTKDTLIIVLTNSSPPRRLRADAVGRGLTDRVLGTARASG